MTNKTQIEKEKDILVDMKAFIGWSLRNNKDLFWVLLNLQHDINGIITEDRFFVPRTKGYDKFLEELK